MYDEEIIRIIRVIYIVFCVVWILIFFWLKSHFEGYFIWIFMLIPLIVFLCNFMCIDGIDSNMERLMCRGNYLAICLLIVDIILNWNKSLEQDSMILYFRILFVAFIFIILSFFDVWVTIREISIVKHIKSIFQTMAITLLCFALYVYYIQYKKC